MADASTLIFDIETCPNMNGIVAGPGVTVMSTDGNDLLIYAGDYSVTNTDISGNDKRKTMVENFVEAFDVCGPGGAIIERILKNKHSERTEEDKEKLRWFFKEERKKRKKPKINIQPEPQIPYWNSDYSINLDVSNDLNNNLGVSLDENGNYVGAQM